MLHEEGVKVYTPEGAEAVLREMGRDPRHVGQAVGDSSTSEELRVDHQRAVDLGVYGVPTLVIDGVNVLFGPVITPAPTGPAAARLWDAVFAWTEFPYLYEIQRPKVEADRRHVKASFESFRIARPSAGGTTGDQDDHLDCPSRQPAAQPQPRPEAVRGQNSPKRMTEATPNRIE